MSNQSGNTNASHRRKMAREALRLKIDGERCLNTIDEAVDQIRSGEDHAKWKAVADIQFGKLKKILPDLRSVELSGDEDNPLFTKAVVEFVGDDEPEVAVSEET